VVILCFLCIIPCGSYTYNCLEMKVNINVHEDLVQRQAMRFCRWFLFYERNSWIILKVIVYLNQSDLLILNEGMSIDCVRVYDNLTLKIIKFPYERAKMIWFVLIDVADSTFHERSFGPFMKYGNYFYLCDMHHGKMANETYNEMTFLCLW